MSDEIFHDVAYRARNRNDLLDGVDEFLDSVTVRFCQSKFESPNTIQRFYRLVNGIQKFV